MGRIYCDRIENAVDQSDMRDPHDIILRLNLHWNTMRTSLRCIHQKGGSYQLNYPLPINNEGSHKAICGKLNNISKAITKAVRKGTAPL